MSRYRKPLLITAAILGGLLLLGIITSLILGPRIKGIAIQQINNQLKTPAQVEDISFSIFRKFPYASIDFNSIKIQGSKVNGYREPLLEARHVYLMFNLFNIFSDDLKLKKIGIDDASAHLFIDADGKVNYDIFKSNTTSNKAFNLELEKVELTHVEMTYYSKPSGRDYVVSTKSAALEGKFSDQIYDLHAAGEFFVTRFKIEEVNYLDHKETAVDLNLHVDTKQNLYTLDKAKLQVASLKLELNGFLRNETDAVNMDLAIKSEDAGLKELLSLIPGLYTENLKNYRYDGAIYFNMRIKGKSDKHTTPLVIAEFGTNNASLKPTGSDYSLNHIKFKGSYLSKISASRPVSRIQLSGLEAIMEGQPLKASLLIEDFADPSIDLQLKSKINLEVLSRFYMPDTMESINGHFFVDAHIVGKSKDKSSWVSTGTLTAESVNFRIKSKNIDFKDFNGHFDISGNRLKVTNFRGNAAGSDVSGSGTFENIFGYFFTKDEKISGQASISSRNIDLNELLEDKNQTSVNDTNYRLDFSNRIDLSIQTSIAYLRFRKFEAWQMKGNIEVRNKILSTGNLSFKAFEGTLVLQGSINASRNDSILIACDVDVNKINITELFSQMGNFGQQTLLDKNVKGNLTATIQFASTWSKSLHCNPDRIYARCDLLIENGELNNFTPLLVLSKYLKGADLRQVKFSTMKNQIEIKNQTIFIPAMQIQSSAMNLTASGTHTFNNMVDYKLQLLLSQLMGRKVKEQHTEFGTIEDDGLGRMKLFLSMKGPIDNPKITYDRKGVEEKITNDIRQEKQNLKNVLKEEFGWFKKDTVKTPPKPLKVKKEELQLESDEQ
ncbi:AsmA-like C-terminal region-containing protein [soil metagenome]